MNFFRGRVLGFCLALGMEIQRFFESKWSFLGVSKAALPGQLLSCAGGGGDADRAFAQLEPEKTNFRASCLMSADARLSIQYDGFGGLVVGEVRGNSLVT